MRIPKPSPMVSVTLGVILLSVSLSLHKNDIASGLALLGFYCLVVGLFRLVVRSLNDFQE